MELDAVLSLELVPFRQLSLINQNKTYFLDCQGSKGLTITTCKTF